MKISQKAQKAIYTVEKYKNNFVLCIEIIILISYTVYIINFVKGKLFL